MLRELVLAVGIPLLVVLLGVLALQLWRDQLPSWLQRLTERPAWLWNAGIGLIIALSLLRWLLQRRGLCRQPLLALLPDMQAALILPCSNLREFKTADQRTP